MADEVVVPILEIKEEFATCDNCKDYYDDKDKSPKILPCFHTFCSNCLEKRFDKSLKQITCPKCQHIWPIDTTIQKTFPQNNMIMNLVEYIRLKNKPEDLVCHQCPNKSKANVRCLDCQQYLCDECASYHRRFPVLKDHKSLLIAEFIDMPREEFFQQKEVCKLHESMKLDLFCEKCSSAACSSCAHVSHRNHEMHNLKDIYTDRKKKVSIAVKNLQTSTDSSKEHRKKLAEQNKILSVMQKNLLKTIDDSSTLIIQKVEEKAEQLKQHVIENISKQTAERDDEVKLLTQSEVAKAEHTLYCQQALSFARAVEFTDMSEGLENKIKTLTRRPELRDIAIQNVTVDLDVFKNMDKILQEPAMVDMLNMKTCIEVTDVIANQMSEVIKVSLLSQGVQSLELQASIKDPKDNRQAVRNKMKRFSSTVGRVLYKAANTGPHEIFVSVNGVQLVDHGIVFQAKHLDAEQAKKLLFSIDDQPRQYQELLLPPVKFDRNKLNYERGNITKDGFLISKDSSSRDRPPTWKCFVGVPSETPIGGPGHNYWQTRVYCGMLESGELNLTAVGAGICPIDKCDDGYLIHSNENAYGIGVVSCRNHKRMCLYVFSQGRTVQDIPIASFKTHASLQMDLGFLLNSDKKILHIIDVLSNKVMHSIQDIDVSKPFLPLFGIYNSDTFDSKLKIIASTDLLSDAALLLLLSSLL